MFFLEPCFEFGGPKRLGWAALGWAALGWAGLGWAGLGWAGAAGWAAGWGLGWALAWGWAGWAGGLCWVGLWKLWPRSKEKAASIYVRGVQTHYRQAKHRASIAYIADVRLP